MRSEPVATPGNVDTTPPTLDAAAGAGEIRGTAHDNLAVWSVRWRDNLGRAGVAELNFRITQGSPLYIENWRMDWRIPRSALTNRASSVRVVAVDIQGNASAPAVVSLGGPQPPTTEPPVDAGSGVRLTGTPRGGWSSPGGTPASGSRRGRKSDGRLPLPRSTGGPGRSAGRARSRIGSGRRGAGHGTGLRWSPSTRAASRGRRRVGAFASSAADGLTSP